MLRSPSTSGGFYGPFGTNQNNTWGYVGADAVLAQCPAGQKVVGVTTAFTTLGGFNSFQVSGPSTHFADIESVQLWRIVVSKVVDISGPPLDGQASAKCLLTV